MLSHRYLLLVIIALSLGSSFGLILLESDKPWTFLDAFFFIIITLTTIGYGETFPLSNEGKVYMIFIMLIGLTLFGYTLSVILHLFLNDYLGGYFKNLSEQKKMEYFSQLENHYIICGYGYLGKYISSELLKLGFKIIIIDVINPDMKIPENLKEHFISGPPDNDESLISSGIKKAKTIIIVTDNDPKNIYITMNARILNPTIYIISSYKIHSNKQKIIVAGCNKIIPIYALASMEILEHLVNKFLSFSIEHEKIEKAIELDELISDIFVITKRSNFHKKIGLEIEIKARIDSNIKIIGIIDTNGKLYHDFRSIKLKHKYKLLILGKELDIELFKLKNS